MIQIFRNPKYDFMGLRHYGYIFSGLILAASIAGLVWHKQQTATATSSGDMLNYGIDFKGGTLLQVRFPAPPQVEQIRDTLKAAGFDNASIQSYGDKAENTVLIRVPEHLEANKDLVTKITTALRSPDERQKETQGLIDVNTAGERVLAEFLEREATGTVAPVTDPLYLRAGTAIVAFRGKQPGGLITSVESLKDLPLPAPPPPAKVEGADSEVLPPSAPESLSPAMYDVLQKKTFLGTVALLRIESVGPAVGAKLRTQALWASIVANGLILCYLWFRFELRFGVAAVLCLVHDVLFIVGVFAFTRREFDLTVLAAILTVIGYSVNDTVVVFDRVRTNLKLMKKEKLETILNTSINQTLSRTVLTSGLTLLVVIGLYLFGGEVLNGFAFALLLGIIEGTYSSIFVASPLLLVWEKYVAKKAV